MVWYDANRIERTVTRKFVCSHLLPDEIERLDRPVAFGDGLTDGTYWEWIDEKAKKIFLILVDLHVPDQIFGVIDDSWDDEDLPIAREHVERLALTPNRDARFDRKFHQRQYYYLLKPLERSDEVVIYDDMEVVPLDLVDRSPGGSGSIGSDGSGSPGGGSGSGLTGSSSSGSGLGSGSSGLPGGGDRVALPNYPGMVFARRRIPLAPMAGSAYGYGYVTLDEFQYEVTSIKSVQNDHLVSYFTSYVHQGYGYVLFTPAGEGSLKSLLATTPAPVKALAKRDRRRLIFNWIHCLVDTLCFVHNRGLSHGNIKPSTVLFSHHNNDNHIFFSDFTHFGMDSSGSSHDKASFDKESYDYAAPEQWYRPSGSSSGGSGGVGVGASSGSSSRKSTLTGEGGSGGRGAGMSMYAGSVYGSSSSRDSAIGSGMTSSRHRQNSGENVGLGLSMSPDQHMTTASGFAFQVGASANFSISRSNTMGGGAGGGDGYYSSSNGNSGLNVPIPQLNPQAADVFSLGCIILELLSFMLKRQTRSFATHRAAKHKTPGRGGAVLDSSFHKNLGQVESWMTGLARDAASSLGKKRSMKAGSEDSDGTLAGVAPMLHVVERMMALHASERPSAYDVQTRMYQILRDHCGISEPHCVHEYGGFNTGWLDYTSYAGVDMDTMMANSAGDVSGSYYSYGGTAAGSYGAGGAGDYGSSYSHSPRLIMSTNGTNTTSDSSRAVSPTAMIAMSPTSTSIVGGGGGYSWSSNSGAVSPAAGPSRTGSFNYGYGSFSSNHHTANQRSMSGRRAAVHHARNDSSSGGSARSSVAGVGGGGGGGGASVILEESETGSVASSKDGIKDGIKDVKDVKDGGKGGGFDLSNGLQAIRNLQIRDKVRQPWNSPVYAA
ncbi:protein kinase domain containing protein [Sporothrix schenckii 1099-18]|uniref:Protein kinase domain containing protein n=1 Tax=Sporothrix schenckii 1099-18 TaxID=1397361 RepID=A0A0F2MBP1_SPOSC|nr:protein kinase domain containing protein [Sporothrix schenckii 1099-18]KJR87052.1 protein kinase domain containing protein [Sporothrix schenckii 1099-18]